MPETDARRLEAARTEFKTLCYVMDGAPWLLAQAAQAQELRAALEAARDMLGNILWGNRNGGGPENSEIADALAAADRALEKKP